MALYNLHCSLFLVTVAMTLFYSPQRGAMGLREAKYLRYRPSAHLGLTSAAFSPLMCTGPALAITPPSSGNPEVQVQPCPTELTHFSLA